MNKQFSIYLEIARITATLIVVLSHGLIFYQPLAEYNETAKLGRDGVIIFFVLSGFVITWCANERDHLFTDYIVNRASRIYSVAIPGIILGAAASLFASINANQDIEYPFYKPWLYLPLYLTFTGNFWHLSEVPPGNFPYWSLNFEVWYYVVFAAFFYIRNIFRWPLAIGLSILVGPGVFQLFPLWIAGSLLYYLRNRVRLAQGLARIVLALTVIVFVVIKINALDNFVDQYNAALWGFLFSAKSVAPSQLLGDYTLGIIVVVNFIAAYNANLAFGGMTEKWVKYLASFSFSFYLFHVPILSFFQMIISSKESFSVYLLVMVCISVMIIFLAKFTEHKKGAYRTFFRYLTQWMRRSFRISN
jgi:peptidoglycan/LPS O-acetylase OafA/YrhL